MAVTVADIREVLLDIVEDQSADVYSSAEILRAITSGVVSVQEIQLNEHQTKKVPVNYYDTLNYYKLTGSVDDVLGAVDVNTKILTNAGQPFTYKSSQELRAEIGEQFMESSYALERANGEIYLVINHDSRYRALQASTCYSLTADGGIWEVDTVNSDATNLRVDTGDFTVGTASFAFDIDVSQSANDRGTLQNTALNPEDLSSDKDITTWLIDVKLPTITDITSYTLRWGSSTSDYYTVTQTTDVNGNPFTVGWQTLGFDWLGSTVVGTPDDSAINYIRLDVNFANTMVDATSFKVDNIRLVRPEILDFYYTSWSVGTNSSGTPITKFTSTTDIPYFSGQYDQYIHPVAQYAASYLYRGVRLYKEADIHEANGVRMMGRLNKIVPKSMTREMKSFKVGGVNLRRPWSRGYRRFF